MYCPLRICIPVFDTEYYLEVALRKKDCIDEPEHCYVCKYGKHRLAKIWLSSCTFESTPRNILQYDQERILEVVSRNMDELQEAYNYNREYGYD